MTSATTEATCTEDGAIVYTATAGEYSDSVTVVIPAAGHNFEEGKCTVCGEKDPDYNPIASWLDKLFGKWWGNNDEEETPETSAPSEPETSEPAPSEPAPSEPEEDTTPGWGGIFDWFFGWFH